jgi:uncharacterized protein YjbJ (UPF0337 family)
VGKLTDNLNDTTEEIQKKLEGSIKNLVWY